MARFTYSFKLLAEFVRFAREHKTYWISRNSVSTSSDDVVQTALMTSGVVSTQS